MANNLLSIDFIDENPAMKAFREGQRTDAALRQADATLDQTQIANDFSRASNPTRLRNLEATTTTNEVHARHAEDDANAAARERAARTEIAVTRGINDRLDAGDNEGADRIAKSAGVNIPPEWRQSAETRRVIKDATTYAEKYYDRAEDQHDYLTKALTTVAEKRQRGEPVDDTLLANVPGMKPPTKTATRDRGFQLYTQQGTDENGKPTVTPRRFNQSTGALEDIEGASPGMIARPGSGSAGAGAGGGQTERLVRQLQQEARERGEDLSTADAIAITKRAPNGDMLTLRKEALAQAAAKADIEFSVNGPATLDKWRKKYGLGDAPAGPAAAPAAPPRAPTAPAAGVPTSSIENDRPEIVEARMALGRGVPRARIEQRLREKGIQFVPGDLDLN